MQACLVTVIVPARNAGALLDSCLGALCPESGDEAEIIVVDDGSTDDTVERAKAYGARVLQMGENAGPSRARNRGAAEARGEILFFIDADVVVQPGAIRSIRKFLDENPKVAAVFGSYDMEPTARGTLTQYRNLVHHYFHQHGRVEASTFWSGCGAIRRSVFLELGGFDEAEYPRCIEDIELGYRLCRAGYSVRLDKSLLCTHMKRWTLLSVIRTDIFCRAIPWARLNLKRKTSPDDLNIKKSQRFSVALVGLACLCLILVLAHRWFLVGAGLAFLLILLLNAGLFTFFFKKRGLVFTMKCIPLHLLYFLYSGLSYIYVWAAFKLNLDVRDGNYKG